MKPDFKKWFKESRKAMAFVWDINQFAEDYAENKAKGEYDRGFADGHSKGYVLGQTSNPENNPAYQKHNKE